MTFILFYNVTYKLFAYKSFILIYTYKEDLALNNLYAVELNQNKQNLTVL